MSWANRPALDGLRTLAVYLVVLYHAGLGWAAGGFVGVDLFFVLSGFLVGSILMNELAETGRIRLWRFYGRRVRRLLPAALVTVIGTSLVFVLVASSVRRLPWVGDAQSALLYVANWRFLLQADDYFATDVDRSPFLHFWSLSIEEQFYLAFPLLLLCLAPVVRRRPAALPWVLLVLLGAGVATQVVWAEVSATHAYYGTDARAYQLLAGVTAAWWWRERSPAAASRGTVEGEPPGRGPSVVASVSGLVLLLVATSIVDLTPSGRSLIATAATVGLVLGLMAAGDRGVARPLGHRVPVYLGQISYGTYLWHWPLTLLLLEVLDTSPWVIAGLVLVVATSLASLSFHVLEHPVRASRKLAAVAPAVVAAGLVASVVVALLVPTVLESPRRPALATEEIQGGRGARVPPGIDLRRYARDNGPDDLLCTDDDPSSCVVARGGSGLHVALVGDSHARMMAPLLQDLAEEHDFTLSLNIGVACPWQHDLAWEAEDRPECEQNRDDLYSGLLGAMDVDVVVLSQQQRDRGIYAAAGRRSGYDQREFDAFNEFSMRGTLKEIRAEGADAVMIRPILMVPETQPHPLDCLARARFTSQCVVPVPTVPPPSDGFQAALGATQAGAAALTLNDLVCTDAPLCQPLRGEVPVWGDRHHLTPSVLLDLSDEIWRRLEATGYFSD